MTLEVLTPGLATTFQDLGRHGYQHWGVPVGGPMDEVSHRLANALLSNAAGRAGARDHPARANAALPWSLASCPDRCGPGRVAEWPALATRRDADLARGRPAKLRSPSQRRPRLSSRSRRLPPETGAGQSHHQPTRRLRWKACLPAGESAGFRKCCKTLGIPKPKSANDSNRPKAAVGGRPVADLRRGR